MRVAKTKTEAFKLFFFLFQRSHGKRVFEKRSMKQIDFTTFDFATFKRHVFRKELPKDDRKNLGTNVKLGFWWPNRKQLQFWSPNTFNIVSLLLF